MRITQSMYYKNVTNESHTANRRLFDVNRQISSGMKIQYASDDIGIFSETMNLDNEMTILGQITSSVESGLKISDQTDSILNEFSTTMDRVKTLLIQASNDSNSELSRDAVSSELRGLEKHLKSLANTSINGKYLFSGSAVGVKPIANDGSYKGNDIAMHSFLGSGVEQQFNVTGDSLFLGEESGVKRTITTNVPQYNLAAKYPDFNDITIPGTNKTITTDDTIRDLMGDTDDDITNSLSSHFYLNGVKSDGTAFTNKITMSANDKVNDLLVKIGNSFGNTSTVDIVNVSLNLYGEIVVEDKVQGSSKLDFHMVGATDYEQTDGNDSADIDDAIYATAGLIDNLNDGETNFESIINASSTAADPKLYVKNFVQSPYTTVTTPASKFNNAEYVMSRSVAAGDTLGITLSGFPAYTQAFTVDSATTYDALKTQIEADGDFYVTVKSNTITLKPTSQGLASGSTVTVPLSNDNGSGVGAVTVTATTTNSTPPTDIGALVYDRTKFTQDGNKLLSSTPQVTKAFNSSTNPPTELIHNSFASPSTKISDVADISKGTSVLTDDTLDGTQFLLAGNDVNGAAFNVQINFASAGSTFTLDSGVTNYDIFDISSTPRAAVDADDMTYQQLMDVINMVTTAQLPATNNVSGNKIQEAIDYDTAIKTSELIGNTTLSYDGKVQFEDLQSTNTKASIALYDSNAGNFNSVPSVMTFNSNNALTVRDAKTDFFKTIDELIKSVEDYKLYSDATKGGERTLGIEDSLVAIDDLQNHVLKSHAFIGTQSNSLNRSLERTQTLEITTMSLRSSVVDTDLAEASLLLTQLSNNFEAMLYTVGKVSKLSLVNYL